MTKFLRAAVCASALALCCPARVASGEDPCPDAADQHALNRCAAQEFRKADADLNKIYQQLMKGAGAAEKVKLRAAQLAWIKFRDAHCDYQSFGNAGGSIYPMVYNFCLAGVMRERTEQFKEILKEAGQR